MSNDDDNGLWEFSTQDGGSAFPPPTPPNSSASTQLPPTVAMPTAPDDWPAGSGVSVNEPAGSDPRRPYVVGGIAFVVMLVVGLFIANVIGGGDSDEPVTVAPASTVPVVATTTQAPSPATTTPATTVAPATTIAPTTSTEAPAQIDGSILVATRDGVFRVAPTGTEKILDEGQQVALGLPDGRLVVQANGGRMAAGAAETAVYLVSTDGQKQVVVSPTPGSSEYITLHDAFERDGAWHVLVTIHVGSNIDDSRDDLVMVNLDTGVRTQLGYVGGWEDGSGRFSVAGNLAVSEFYVTVTRGPLFIDLAGGSTPDPRNFGLAESYDDCTVCPSLFAIRPGGTELAWVEGEFVVIADTATGVQKAALALPRQLGTLAISSDVGSSGVIVNFRAPYGMGDAPVPNPIVVTREGKIVELPREGVASFTEK